MKLFYYPDVVNENITRIVASMVCTITLLTIFSFSFFSFTATVMLCSLLSAGFILRTLWGPKVDPFAWFAANILPKFIKLSFVPTAGPPKRFAQSIGIIFSVTAFILFLNHHIVASQVTLGILAFFAFLESVFAFCAGCFVFSLLMKAGIIPEEVCERCNNLQLDRQEAG